MKLALILTALTAVSATAIPREAAADDTNLDARDLEKRVGPFRITAKTGLTCRSGPSSSASVVRTYQYGALVSFNCQRQGTKINDNPWWDMVGDCYVADYYVSTGHVGGNYPGVPGCYVGLPPPPKCYGDTNCVQ